MAEGRRSALAAVGSPELGGPRHAVHLREAAPQRLTHLQGAGHDEARQALLAVLDSPELPAPGRSLMAAGVRLLSIGPAIYLLIENPGASLALPAATIERGFAVGLNVTDACTRLQIAGPEAATLLAAGTAVDLHPRSFPPGRGTATGFARMRVILLRTGLQQFELLIGRSHALSLWQWLAEAAAEFLPSSGQLRASSRLQQGGQP